MEKVIPFIARGNRYKAVYMGKVNGNHTYVIEENEGENKFTTAFLTVTVCPGESIEANLADWAVALPEKESA